MELEIVNKLYLELSQVATATTARELELTHAANAGLMALLGYLPAHRNAVTDAAIARLRAALRVEAP